MHGGTRAEPVDALLYVEADVFEAVASAGVLTGPLDGLARQFGVDPSDLLTSLDARARAGWVAVAGDPDGVVSVRLEP